jgi:hypothetical protein
MQTHDPELACMRACIVACTRHHVHSSPRLKVLMHTNSCILTCTSTQGMDKFVHVWPGGCRAAGAAWKSDSYTREGLRDVVQLTRGLKAHGAQVPSWLDESTDANNKVSEGVKVVGTKRTRSPSKTQISADEVLTAA